MYILSLCEIPLYIWSHSGDLYLCEMIALGAIVLHFYCLFKSLVRGQCSDHLIYSANSFKSEAAERQSKAAERLIKPLRHRGNHSEDLRLQLLRDVQSKWALRTFLVRLSRMNKSRRMSFRLQFL